MTSPSTDRRYGVNPGLAIKAPVVAATTAAITLNGVQTIDGVSVVADDRVLVKDQADTTANGIYICDTGDWTRDIDANGNRDLVKGTTVLVTGGSTYINTYWQITTSNPIVIGTSGIVFAQAMTSDSSMLSFLQAGTGAVQRTGQDKMREGVSLMDFGAVGNGIANDSAAMVLALAASDVVYGVSGDVYYLGTNVTVPSNKKLFGGGAVLKSGNGITMLSLTGDDCEISGWEVQANGGLYTIAESGDRNTIRNNLFTGDVGHYVYCSSGSKYVSIKDNVCDGEEISRITTSFVVEAAINPSVTGNRFVNTENWCIQVRGDPVGSQGVVVANNNCFATAYTDTVVATAAQTVFDFTLSTPVHLAGIQIDGIPFATGLTFSPVIVPGLTPTTTWRVTFAAGRSAGESVKLIGHRAAENIQINGYTSDYTVIGNVCSGGGDSGIVNAGSCVRGTISGNVIRDVASAGISIEGGIQQIAVTGNQIYNASMTNTSAAFSSGILVSGPDISVTGNTITNIFGFPTMSSGISINYDADDDGQFDESIKVGVNTYGGAFVNGKVYMPNEDTLSKKSSVAIIDGMTTRYPEQLSVAVDAAWANAPSGTNYFGFSFFGGTGVIRDTSIKQGGVASIKTVPNEYLDITPSAAAILMDTVVNISFWAISNSGSSYVTVFLDVAGSVVGSPSLTIDYTGWKQYNICFPVSYAIDTTAFVIRIGGAAGFANFQHFDITMTKV